MIRNFIYLDESKMQSLSSQMFEGVKDYIISETHSHDSDEDEQKGPMGSGLLAKKSMESGVSRMEKVTLQDFVYAELEKALIEENKVYINKVDGEYRSFVKVKGRVLINDISNIKAMLEDFEEVGDAIVYTQFHQEISRVQSEIDELKSQSSKAANKNRINELKSKIDLKQLRKLSLVDFPEATLITELNKLIKFAYKDELELQVYAGKDVYSSVLKREHLRENIDLLIRKYGRKTEVEFVLFGIITQRTPSTKRDSFTEKFSGNFPEAKEAIFDLIDHIIDMEDTMSTLGEGEFAVDPIAIYTEI